VKWSLMRLKNIKGGPSFLMDSLDSIDTPDAHTVIIKLSGPNSDFLGILAAAYAGIVNSDLASANGANDKDDAATSDTADAWFLSHSAGGGPFVLEGYKADDELRLSRNDKFWGKKPPISAVIMKQSADAVSQVQMLQSGAADIAMQVDPDTANTVKDENIVFKTVPSFNFVYLAMSPVAKGSPVPLSKDVREAIKLAVDYKGAIDFTLGGAGALTPVAIPNGFPGTDKLPEPKEDLAKAKQLLAKAGAAKGFELTLEYPNMNVYGVDLGLLAQKIQQDLARIDVKLTLKPAAFNVWLDDIRTPIPFTIGFYAPDYFGSAQYVQYFGMIPDQPWAKRAGVGKVEGLDGKAELALFQKAQAATPGTAQDDAYRAVAQAMIDDTIIVPILSPNLVLAYRKDVEGVRYSACCNLPLDEITKK
jgi:peptide/nickel transport system substrate-binding protein